MKTLKVKKNEIKSCRCAYLYEDGHLVLVHEKRDNDAGYVNWVTIYENIGIRCQFEGRLIIDPGALSFVLHATRITANEADYKNGSDNTRKRGLRVGTITLYNGTDHRGWIISTMPDVISCDINYQNETPGTFSETLEKHRYHWGTYTVKSIYQCTV